MLLSGGTSEETWRESS